MASYLENTLENVVALSGKNKVTYKKELRVSYHLYGYELGQDIPRRDLEHFAQLAMVYRTQLSAVPELKKLVKRNKVTLRFVKNYDPLEDAMGFAIVLGNSLGFLRSGAYGVLYFDGQSDRAYNNESWSEFNESVKELLLNLRDNFYDEQVTLYDR